MTRRVFLDTETTSLDRRERRIWEIAYIIEDDGSRDVEKHMFVHVSLRNADPISLQIGKYYQRHPAPIIDKAYKLNDQLKYEYQMAHTVAQDFLDAYIVGAVPSFDEESLARALRRSGLQPTWHYHLIDVETLAAGRLGIEPPWDFDTILAKFDLEYLPGERHTALGDARMARALYHKVLAADRADQ